MREKIVTAARSDKLPAGQILMRTRFATSPTGQLHVGHVAAMIYLWGLAARQNAAVNVCVEDHDRQRCRPEFVAQCDLTWSGCSSCPPAAGTGRRNRSIPGDSQPLWRLCAIETWSTPAVAAA